MHYARDTLLLLLTASSALFLGFCFPHPYHEFLIFIWERRSSQEITPIQALPTRRRMHVPRLLERPSDDLQDKDA
jgi:hypothetical protein